MSWEFDNCATCGASMDRVSTRRDDEGRIIMLHRCPNDGTEIETAEPDVTFEARKAIR